MRQNYVRAPNLSITITIPIGGLAKLPLYHANHQYHFDYDYDSTTIYSIVTVVLVVIFF